jgi:predicted metalloprotease with PDZ domain
MELQLSETQRARLLELYQSLQLDYTSVNIQMTSTRIIVQSSSQQTSLTIPTHYRRTRPQNFNRYIEDACNAEVDLDLELYDKGDILSLVSVAIDTAKTNGQRLFAYSKSWSLLSKDLVERQLTMKQLRQEVQQITGQNGARFLTVANRAQRLLSVLGEFPIPQFRYITPNWLYHLTSVDFDYFIRKCREQLSQNMEHFAGAQY